MIFTPPNNPALKLRRIVSAGPAPVSGMKLWLKAGEGMYTDTVPSIVAVNNDPVAYWLDQSGNGNHVVQTTASARPLMKTGLVNGKTALRFDGVDDLLTSLSPTAAVTLATAFIVVKMNSTAANPTMFDSAGGRYQLGLRTAKYEMYQGGGGVLDSVIVAGTVNARIVTGVFRGDATTFIRLDGTTAATGNCGNLTSASSLVVGGRASEFSGSDIYEVLWYETALTAGQCLTTERYLGSKFGITTP